MELSMNYRNMFLYQVYAFLLVLLIFIVFTIINYDLTVGIDMIPFYMKFIIMTIAYYPLVLLYVADISFLHWVRWALSHRYKQYSLIMVNKAY